MGERKTLLNYLISLFGIGIVTADIIAKSSIADTDWWGLLFFTAFFLLLEQFPIYFGDIKLSLSTTVIISAYMLWGNAPASALATVGIFIASLIEGKGLISIENAGLYALSYYTAGAIIDSLTGNLLPYRSVYTFYVILYVLISFAINYIVLYIFLINMNKTAFREYWRESTLWELFSYILIIPSAIILAILYYAEGILFAAVSSACILIVEYYFSLLRKLLYTNRKYTALYEMAGLINSNLELKETCEMVLNTISSAIRYSFAGIYLKSSDGVEAELAASVFYDGFDEVKPIRSCDEGIVGKCITLGTAELYPDIRTSGEFKTDELAKFYRCCIALPLSSTDDTIGCIVICHKDERVYTQDDMNILTALAKQASIAIQNARKFEEISIKAITDSLTTVYNKGFLNIILSNIVKSCEGEKRPISLIMFDIDHFKYVNDSYGHLVGDEALKEVARRIKENVRENDIVARFGGEEFVVILPGLKSNEALLVAERIRNAVSSVPIATQAGNIYLTISGGIAEFPFTAESPEKLIQYADRALYVGSKMGGRNRVTVYQV
ncbi:MAG: sensor domain-containing diguanylate cyclase [Thermoanaerobacteraceae bacterium]|nr:sensor domain-containing diguanylate cyclase [Thermoanaerobacteraceae bacterium]